MMNAPLDLREQQHPLYSRDRDIVNGLLSGEPTDLNLAELARLKIRYRGFPGARDIQRDLDAVLTQWHLTDEQLFAKTRELHNSTRLYTVRSRREVEDWS